jgi:hypothetical protein
MGFIFQCQWAFFSPATGSVASYAYVAKHMTVALKKSTFQVGLFLIPSRSLDLERIGCAEVLMGIGKY